MDEVELSGDAIGNIMTNILERWEGKMVFDEKFTMASIDNRVIYKDTDKWNFLSNYNPENKSGHMYVSKIYKDSYESTVENLEATMLGHEWYSHIIKDYGDEKYNHWKAYSNALCFNYFKMTDKCRHFNQRQMELYRMYNLKILEKVLNL